MQTNQILSAPLLDIIFDGRNKAYGAYELRKTYEKRIRKAMIITFSLAALAFGSVVMASTFKKKDDQYRLKEEMMLTEIKEIQKPEPLPEQPKPKPAEP
ncbi:MAG: energy transducer TonB, partial [Chitinophagaceae bacterium]|nr:energy transducer TonB [Chitinophagaceae bacterium]